MRISPIIKKFSAIVVAIFALTPWVASAAAVTVSDDTTLTLPSDGTSYTLVAGSTFEQLDVQAGSLIFSMSTGESVTVTSADKKALNPNPAVAVTCASDKSSVTLTVASTLPAQAFTLTPSGSCSDTSSTAPNTGGGGTLIVSSAGSGSPPPPAPAPAPTPSGVTASSKSAGVPVPSPTPSSSVATLAQPVFFKNLLPGMRGDEVRQLQTLLRQDKTLYPNGIVNGTFGPATTRAVKNFQKKYGIAQTGTVGPATRAKLIQVFGGQAKKSSPAPKAPLSAGTQALQDQLTRLLKQLQDLQKNKK